MSTHNDDLMLSSCGEEEVSDNEGSNASNETHKKEIIENDSEDNDELNFDFCTKSSEPEMISEKASCSFSSLGLDKWLFDQLKQLSFKTPTLVQMHCIPKILSGNDVIGCAKTGTGKTLAFALPILNQLAIDPFGVYALVLTPTRELAFQIAEQFTALGIPINLKTVVVIGGRDQVAQAQDLSRSPHVVVSTPGRLSDHINSNPNGIAKIFRKIRFLVLDEADRLLDGQYSIELKSIFTTLPRKRQTLLFSATITSALSQLHQVSVKKPYFFEDKSNTTTVDELDQRYVLCPQAVKDAYLVYVVKNFYTNRRESSILVFCQTCRECQAIALMLNALGFQVGSLHSQIAQKERIFSLTRFRSHRIRILICTDVAARGLDIPHVDLVVNHNVPRLPKTYIHRVGRSARAGRFGGAITFVTQYDMNLLHEIEKMVGKKLEAVKVDHKKVTEYVTQVLVTKREAEIKLDQQGFGEKKLINKKKEMLLYNDDMEDVQQTLLKKHIRKRKASTAKKVAMKESKRKRN